MSTENNDWENMSYNDPQGGFMSDNAENPPDGGGEPSKDDVGSAYQGAKKRRGALFWVGTLATFVLLFSIIGGGIYWLTRPTIEDQAFRGEVSPVVVPQTTEMVPEPTSTATLTDTLANTDTQPAVVEESATLPAPQSMPTRTPPRSPKTNNGHSNSLVDNNHLPSNTKSRKEKSPITQQPPITKKQTEVPVLPNTAQKGVSEYVVQVFSSPSKDDAIEWLQLLRDRNVSGGYIAEQKIKGESWFRVRFGSFPSRNAAEDEAMRLGFRQPWVARIR